MKYCTQCMDQNSGQTGCFGYDPAQGNTAGSFHAITPVFSSLAEFFPWCRENGIALDHSNRVGLLDTLDLTRRSYSETC